MTRPSALRCGVIVALALLLSPPLQPRTSAQQAQPERMLLEAEDLLVDDGDWQVISVGQGNYFVDAVGAAHYSDGRMLRLPATAGPSSAHADIEVPQDGEYRVWARYDFPWRDTPASFRILIDQAGETVFDQRYGDVNASRMWFFNLPDAPWQDLQHGVEGPISEAHDAALRAGPARVTLLGESQIPLAADRIVDFVFFTSDLTNDFRQRGERLYPLLDEIGRAVPDRLFARVTNPPEATNLSLEAQYTFNRAPWRSPAVQIGARGAVRGTAAESLAPGSSSPWMNLTCQDTTHACHLHLRAHEPVIGTPTLQLSNAPDDGGLLRELSLTDPASETTVSIPPYPSRDPGNIRSISETVESIVSALESTPVVGRPPVRFPIYAGLGDNVERRLGSSDPVSSLYRRLFFLTGVNAFNNLNVSAVTSEVGAAAIEGKALGRFFTYGDYRWFPTDERIDKARRDLSSGAAQQYLRGFTLGDEIKLSDWYPREAEGDALFRQAMQTLGETPEALGGTEWADIHLETSRRRAASQPRLFVRSRQFQDEYALQHLRAGVERLRDAFGPDVLIGANFSPHPDFRPEVATFVKAFREGGLTLASHSDYWWQASEMGPESTGFLIDAFRAGLRDRSGVIQPYVMPHSPGNTDRDLMLGLWSAIIHGARAVDLFRVGPEQINTENYIASSDLDRYRTIRQMLHLLGPAEDSLLDGVTWPTPVALVLAESTDRWEEITPAHGPGLPDGTGMTSQASNTERKGLWQALRHAHVPVDMLTEEDLTTGVINRYRVIYLAGPQLSSEAAQGLAQWVYRGGT
ncbi:MAG TPA: hypothetical protein VHX16_13275, partial [Chloroflexota bacterium]|nr:hypothetical protein [Chloroflexota bacterium]